MSTTISIESSLAFYQSALAGLRFLESTLTGRSLFGPDADARWNGFKGDLGTRERIDILLRDASVKWAAAFSPARVFQLAGLAADEPMGPDWPGIDEDRARKLWREAEQLEFASPSEAMSRVAKAWGTGEQSSMVAVGELASATRVLVAGPSAVVATMEAFLGRDDLSWADQVVVVGSAPAERHLGGFAAVAVGSRGPTHLVSPEQARSANQTPAAAVREAGLPSVDRAIISDDASPAARDFARAAADSLR